MNKAFIITFIAIATYGCFYYLNQDIDAVSSATYAANKKITLPKESGDYKVNVVNGLKKYAVTYSDSFCRGGEIQTVEGIKALKKWGIETIISITPTDQERALTKQFGIKLVELEFECTNLPQETIESFCNTLKTSKKVYTHCHGGTHRAGALGIAYRMLKEGWSFEKASKEFVALGGYPSKDKAMLDAVKSYMEKRK